jgi:hypothetical protein
VLKCRLSIIVEDGGVRVVMYVCENAAISNQAKRAVLILPMYNRKYPILTQKFTKILRQKVVITTVN